MGRKVEFHSWLEETPVFQERKIEVFGGKRISSNQLRGPPEKQKNHEGGENGG